MGTDKAMLPHPSGKSFLDHAVQRFSTVADQVAISGRVTQDSSLTHIADLSPSMGPAMAVYSAVLFASQNRFDAVIVTPVDMPDLSVDHIKQLVAAGNESEPTCAVFESKIPHPLVAIYPAILLQELEQVALSPQRSLRRWLSTRSFIAVSFESLTLRDINTPEQFSSCNKRS